MLGLLLPTIFTSATDSLNPFAITQQFVLQGLVKRPHHIWFFILPTGIVNLIGGLLVYFGLSAFIGEFMTALIAKHGRTLFTLELIIGIALLVFACTCLQNAKIAALTKQVNALQGQSPQSTACDEASARRKIHSVSPFALIMLGACATLSELATALPYFAFLSILSGQQLPATHAVLLLIVYNFIYMLPLMLLYVLYRRAQHAFDRIYLRTKSLVSKTADALAPALSGLASIAMVYHSLSLLLQ